MKIFRILPLLLLFLFTLVSSVKAQEEPQPPKKETIIIDRFTKSSSIKESTMDGVRGTVVSALSELNRMFVIDATTETKLSNMNQKRGEDEVNEMNVLEESRSAALKQFGAKYLMTGKVSNYSSESKYIASKRTYTVNILFSLKIFNIVTGEAVSSKQFKVSGIGDSASKAEISAISNSDYEIRKYIETDFPIVTKIIQLEAKNKRGKLKELYILAGSNHGFKQGNPFEVYTEKRIAGIVTKSLIGKIRIKDVVGENVSLCNVTKGHAEIEKAFNENPETLIVMSVAGLDLFSLF